MKKSVLCLITVFFSLLLSVNCLAVKTNDMISRHENERLEAYKQIQVELGKSQAQADEIALQSDNIYGNDILFKKHYMIKEDIMAVYKKSGSFKSLISDSYSWILSSNNGEGWERSFKYDESLDRLKSTGMSSTVKYPDSNGKKIFVDFSFENIVEQMSSKLGVDEFDDFELVYSYDYGSTYFLYAAVNNEEYVIPYCVRTDFTGLENGKLYTAKECLAILDKNMPEVSDNYITDEERVERVPGMTLGGGSGSQSEEETTGGTVVTEPESSDALNAEDVPVSENVEFGRNDADVPTATDGDKKPDNTVFYIILASVVIIVIAGAVLLALKKKK